MDIREQNGGVTFAVRVIPRAGRNAIEGEYQGALKVRLTAPPVDDRANEELRRLLAGRLEVPLAAVNILGGGKSRTKQVSISGVSRAQILGLFEQQRVEADSPDAGH